MASKKEMENGLTETIRFRANKECIGPLRDPDGYTIKSICASLTDESKVVFEVGYKGIAYTFPPAILADEGAETIMDLNTMTATTTSKTGKVSVSKIILCQ